MTIKLTIVGLGQIGASIGLALAEQTDLLHRIGHDREPEKARQAKNLGAVDEVALNLPNSVQDADIVLLALPMDEIHATLDIIASVLKEGAVVMDTAPMKEVVSAWASELLPANRHYVGLTPVINPAYLHDPDKGLEAAHADLFKQGLIAIVAPARASSEAVKLAADLTRLLGATPLFADPLEMDGLMAATHLIPQLIAAALLNATVDQPGWREGRKVAGRAYAEATGPIVHLSEPKTLQTSVLLNRENVLRTLDGVIAALQTLRGDIHEDNGPALLERLKRARHSREIWWESRQSGKWVNEGEYSFGQDELPSSDIFSRLLRFGRRKNDNE